MRRVFCVLVVLAFVCALPTLSAFAEEVTVSSAMKGALFSSLWGGTQGDAFARRLLNGLSPVYWDEEHHRYRQNGNVAEGISISETPDGEKEYLIEFSQQLRFSDGSPVTARDYALTVLVLASPYMEELGARGSAYCHLSGWSSYHTGKSRVFSGVRLIGDHQLALTIAPEYLPCFFESVLISVTPLPMSALFPELGIYDEGDGAFIASAEDSSRGGLSVDMLRAALLDPVTGYLSAPAVTSGAYSFVSFDGETLVLEENPYHSGPVVACSPMPDAFTCLAFACERKTLSSANLRKAIALCVDRDGLLSAAQIGPDSAVNGFCSVNDPSLAHPANTLSWPYQSDMYAAVKLLEEDGWTLDENGESYDAAYDGVHCRLEDGELVRLSLSISYEMDGAFDDGAIAACLVDRLAQIGVELICEPLDTSELDRIALSPGKRLSDLMLVSVEMSPDEDLSAFFKPNGAGNIFGINDPELYQAARNAYRTPEGDYAEYFANWLEFQSAFTGTLPAIPLYCVEYPYHIQDERNLS